MAQEVVQVKVVQPQLSPREVGLEDKPAGRLTRRSVAVTAAVTASLAACAAVAALVASRGDTSEPAQELPPAAGTPAPMGGSDPHADLGCRTARFGDPCYRHVEWAMQHGLSQRPELFQGLAPNSSFEEFQAALHADPFARCPLPCSAVPAAPTTARPSTSAAQAAPPSTSARPSTSSSAPASDGEVSDDDVDGAANLSNANFTNGSNDADNSSLTNGNNVSVQEEPPPPMPIGWETSDRMVAEGQWCGVGVPKSDWLIRECGGGGGAQLKVLTYNLFWWNLFGRRSGNGGSAGRLIALNSAPEPFDLMGFQECENVGWVLADAGLTGEFAGLAGPHALCMAYRTAAWDLMAQGAANVGEDRSDQWYGARAAMWVRLRNTGNGQTVFFVNHHGPLPVDSGGRCGGEATAYNLLKLIATEARKGDVVVLVGDFNAGPDAETLRSLRGHLFAAFTGSSFGGVDHVFSSCPAVSATRNLGDGGSDHDALEVVFQL